MNLLIKRLAARFPKVASLARRAPISLVFSDPGIAMIGARHADIEPTSIVTGEVSFENQGAQPGHVAQSRTDTRLH